LTDLDDTFCGATAWRADDRMGAHALMAQKLLQIQELLTQIP
jgi:hypothetical protein